jgi:tetratricopeptide (TPR) repeat protein
MTETRAPRHDPDRLAELEEERRFLLRSLRDLEREREAGDVDEDDYAALRDGYTARAAAVLRSIEAGRSALPAKRPRNWRRIAVVVVAVLVVGIGGGYLVAHFSGLRTDGDTITGGTSPDQVASLLSEGRILLASSSYADALDRYTTALKIEPDNVEALTYGGWVLAVSPQAADPESGPEVLAQAKGLIEQAIAIDPTYADPHCFLAIIAVQFENDPAEATTRKQECLDNNPSSEMRSLLAEYVDPLLAPGSG